MDTPFDLDSDDETSSTLACVSPAILEQLAHLNLAGRLTRTRKIVSAGANGDISKGCCRNQRTGTVKVAIKCLRFYLKDDIITLFEKEIYVWSMLKHDNILPLLGFDIDTGTGYPLLVSEWMDNGSALAYVNAHPEVNPINLITGIACGLAYLHGKGVVHSDIKSDNVLVSPSGNALICDFGCSRVIAASRSLANLSSGVKGTSRYLAPELVSSSSFQNTGHTVKTDVWAFGMTVYELTLRRRPYENLSDIQAIHAIAGLKRPPFSLPSPTLPDPLYGDLCLLRDICSGCWRRRPEKRLDMSIISNALAQRQLSRHNTPLRSSSQWLLFSDVMDCESSPDLLPEDESGLRVLGRLLETDVHSPSLPHGSRSAASYNSPGLQTLPLRASLPGPSNTSFDRVPSYVQRQEHLFSPMNGQGLGMDPMMSPGYNYHTFPDPLPVPGEYTSANLSRKVYASQTTVPTSQGLTSSGNNDILNTWQKFMAGYSNEI